METKLEHRYEEAKKAVAEAIASFPETFELKAFPGETFRIGVRESYVSGDTVLLYTQRLVRGEWLDFAKCAIWELERAIKR
jgi:hypothetical protein